jgi:enterochelin esterase-like enzyme
MLRVADPDRRYTAVRLASDLPLTEAARSFARRDGEWVLDLHPADVQRLEYQLELVGPGGSVEYALDPGNPHRAPGAFGEKSVLLLPGYREPAWLSQAGVEGRYRELEVPGRGLGASVAIRVWEPAGVEPDRPLRLLLAHDGPEYDALASLTRFTAAKIAAQELPPHRVALLAPGDRDQWYSASKRYGRALAHDVIPALRDAFPVVGALAGMGASLGALAMLHLHRSFPRALGGLFLQSGSFFLPRTDAQERRFARFARIVRFVRATQREGALALPIPVTLTVGTAEENAANNRVMAHALAEQGYEVELEEVPDMHNYTGWRDAFDPHLTRLLQRTWTR